MIEMAETGLKASVPAAQRSSMNKYKWNRLSADYAASTLKEGDEVKDPKQIMDSWRTDIKSRNLFSNLLRQFDLEYPNARKNRKKPVPKRQHVNHAAAALSLCLVTGLTVGAGSAFADSEFVKDTPPLDQPASKERVQVHPPQAEDQTVERIIQDRPTENSVESELPKWRPDVHDQEKQAEQNNPVDSASALDQPSQSGEHLPQLNHSKQPDHSLQSRQHQELPPDLNSPPPATSQSKPISSKATRHTQTKRYVQPVKTVQGYEQSEGSKYNVSNSETEYALGSTHSHDVTTDSKQQPLAKAAAEPKTVKGGALPKTASGDLNGVVLGGAVALLGSAYTMFRGRKDQV
jgi:hypothetical protein